MSPKYAPETTAPATNARFTSIPIATPIKATPIVPAEPHDVPVRTDTIAVSKNAVSARYLGLISFSP